MSVDTEVHSSATPEIRNPFTRSSCEGNSVGRSFPKATEFTVRICEVTFLLTRFLTYSKIYRLYLFCATNADETIYLVEFFFGNRLAIISNRLSNISRLMLFAKIVLFKNTLSLYSIIKVFRLKETGRWPVGNVYINVI